MFSAILDTCVLVPSVTRDVLLQIAEADVYRPLWSSEILVELSRTIQKLQADRARDAKVIETYTKRLTTQMNSAFPDALVDGWEAHLNSIVLPDENDRHVVAAAVAGRADVIVTQNVRDFPRAALPAPLFTQTTDVFLLDSLDLRPEAVINGIHIVAARSGRMGVPRTPAEIIDIVGRQGGSRFASAARQILNSS